MLEVKNVSFSYGKGGKTVFENVSFSVEPGERLGIFAPSGFGKTTLLKVLGGYEKPDEGEILMDGIPLPKRGYCPVQMVWQHPEKAVNPRRKMREVLKEGNQIEERIVRSLGIEEDWKNRYPQELSGGELQRFCIARALGEGTKYLLADEISTMLDLITQGQIWNFLMEETKRRRIGMIIVSHSQSLLDHVCTRQLSLEKLSRLEKEGQ